MLLYFKFRDNKFQGGVVTEVGGHTVPTYLKYTTVPNYNVYTVNLSRHWKPKQFSNPTICFFLYQTYINIGPRDFCSHFYIWLYSTTKSKMFLAEPRVQLLIYICICRAGSCQSFIEIYDGQPTKRSKDKAKRLCSPVEKHARDSNGRWVVRRRRCTLITFDKQIVIFYFFFFFFFFNFY